jgi:hypothetical protein
MHDDPEDDPPTNEGNSRDEVNSGRRGRSVLVARRGLRNSQHRRSPTRNVAVQMYMSVDGVMEAPEKWSSAYWTDDHERYTYERLPRPSAG